MGGISKKLAIDLMKRVIVKEYKSFGVDFFLAESYGKGVNFESIDVNFHVQEKANFQGDLTKLEVVEVCNVLDLFSEPCKANRVYIEGDPGTGKSTLCNYLSHTWASERNGLKHFDLVIRANLKDVLKQGGCSADNLAESIIFRRLSSFHDKAMAVVRPALELGARILWILDALDEAEDIEDPATKDLLSHLAAGVPSQFPFMDNVLLTSRPATLTQVKDYRKFRLDRLTESDAMAFVKAYFELFGENQLDKKKEIAKIISGDLGEAFRTPLFLQLLCFVYRENGSIPRRPGGAPLSLFSLYDMALCNLLPSRQIEKLPASVRRFKCSVEDFWMTTLETLACEPEGRMTQANVETAERNDFPDVASLGIVKKYSLRGLPMKATSAKEVAYKFSHTSFVDFFQARRLTMQSEDTIRECFEDKHFWAFRKYFRSDLGLRFFCEALAEKNASLLRAVSTILMKKSLALYVLLWELVRRDQSALLASLCIEVLRSRHGVPDFTICDTRVLTWNVSSDDTEVPSSPIWYVERPLWRELSNSLRDACDLGRPDCVRVLFKALVRVFNRWNFDLESRFKEIFRSLNAAASKGRFECLNFLLKCKAENWRLGEVLYCACRNGHNRCIDLLLGHNQFSEDEMNHALVVAAGVKPINLEGLRVLLRYGADPNSSSKGASGETEALEGWTPLMRAACTGEWDVVKFFLDEGAGEASIALRMAARSGRSELVEKLVQMTNINGVDERGLTALDMIDEHIKMYNSPISREESYLDMGQRRRNYESAIDLRKWMIENGAESGQIEEAMEGSGDAELNSTQDSSLSEDSIVPSLTQSTESSSYHHDLKMLQPDQLSTCSLFLYGLSPDRCAQTSVF